MTTSLTLLASMAGGLVRCSNAAGTDFTVPPHSSVALPVRSSFRLRRTPGAGLVTAIASFGVTLNATALAILSENGELEFTQVALDEWDVREFSGAPLATGGVVATSTQTGAAGDFVNIYDVSGAAKVRLADGSDSTKPADGFILTAMSIGVPVTVWTGGVNTAVSPSAAGQVWLSETTPGGYQTSAPADTAYGHLNQLLGPAIPGTGVAFQRGYPFPV